MNAEGLRLQSRVRQNPQDRGVREALADWLEIQGRGLEATLQRRKARLCERFDPDFRYEDYFPAPEWKVTLFAGGEIVQLKDDIFTYWAEPIPLQLYLKQTPPSELRLADVPLSETLPDEEHLKRLWAEFPGATYVLEIGGCKQYLKKLDEESWLYKDGPDVHLYLTAELWAIGLDLDHLTPA
jgi:hypothetical protein